MNKAVVQRGTGKLLERKQRPLVLGMAGLSAAQAFLLVAGKWRLGGLDYV
jgi:hypothetical protein